MSAAAEPPVATEADAVEPPVATEADAKKLLVGLLKKKIEGINGEIKGEDEDDDDKLLDLTRKRKAFKKVLKDLGDKEGLAMQTIQKALVDLVSETGSCETAAAAAAAAKGVATIAAASFADVAGIPADEGALEAAAVEKAAAVLADEVEKFREEIFLEYEKWGGDTPP